MTNFPDNWITTGWSRGPDGKWLEMGSAGVTSEPAANAPEVSVQDVAEILNRLDRMDLGYRNCIGKSPR